MNEKKAMLKDALILFAITLISGLVLGATYMITKEPIATQEALAKQEACKEVFTDAVSFLPMDSFESVEATAGITEQYPMQTLDEAMVALDAANQVIGYVLTVTTHEGYNGDITFSMGIRLDGTLNGISLLSISETAGLGMNADSVLKPQFINKKAAAFTYTKVAPSNDSEIQAISGATITTKAITNGVNAGLSYFQNTLGGMSNE